MPHHRSMRFALLALLAGGCAYEAGTYRSAFADFAGQRATIDCLDIAVGRAADSIARGALVQISFGNRCDHRVTVDLVSMRAVAHGATLAPYDPRGELEVASAESRQQARRPA